MKNFDNKQEHRKAMVSFSDEMSDRFMVFVVNIIKIEKQIVAHFIRNIDIVLSKKQQC
jgi:hypothetical protein